MTKRAFIVALPDEVHNVNELKGIPVFYSGVGKLNAAIKAMELIQRGYSEIINIGSCGSVQHKLGEIIPIGKVYQDIDGRPLCEYGHTPFEENSEFIIIDTTSEYSCFTTDYFYDHKQDAKYSDEYHGRIKTSSVFDMELFGIAKVCQRNNVKLRAFKWVSDDGNFDHWIENCRLSSEKVLEMID
jgi:adenosylhomocysteine nucleosidase